MLAAIPGIAAGRRKGMQESDAEHVTKPSVCSEDVLCPRT